MVKGLELRSPPMTHRYSIKRTVRPFTSGRWYALRIDAIEGPGLFDWSTVHFSYAKTRATLKRRLERVAPQAVPA